MDKLLNKLYISLALLFSFILPANSANGVESDDKNPITSNSDTKDYSSFTLPNGLEVLVISDPKSLKAAASLAIGVGFHQDPKVYEGLSHLLEHTVLSGSKNYPTVGEYKTFISHNGGWSKASTRQQHTYYRFEINGSKLYDALNRLADLVINPILDKKYIAKQIQSVDSEFRLSIRNDWRATQEVLKKTQNQSHPDTQFSGGNIETLSMSDNLRARLFLHHQYYYVANNAKLVVYGNQSVSELEQKIKVIFDKLPIGKSNINNFPNPPIVTSKELNKQIDVKVFSNSKSLDLRFHVPAAHTQYLNKMGEYIAFLIGHKGKGSLLEYLKSKGYAYNISADLQDSSTHAFFNIYISVTEEGLQQKDKIITLVFGYINMLQTTSIEKHRLEYDNFLKTKLIEFETSEPREIGEYVATLSQNMFNYPKRNWLNHNVVTTGFAPKLMGNYFKLLSPAKLRLLVSDSAVKTDRIEDKYNIGFSYYDIPESRSEKWINPKLPTSIYFPIPNPFLPKNLSSLLSPKKVIDTQGASISKISIKPGINLWTHKNADYPLPTTASRFSIYNQQSDKVSAIKKRLLLEITSEILNQRINPYTYDARLAGIKLSVYSNRQSIGISLDGIAGKQSELLNKVLSDFPATPPSSVEFESARKSLEISYQKANSRDLHRLLRAYLAEEIFLDDFTPSSLLNELGVTTYQEFKILFSQNFKRFEIEAVITGNFENDLPKRFRESLGKYFQSNSTQYIKSAPSILRANQVPLSRYIKLAQKDNALIHYIQGSDEKPLTQVQWLLAKHIFAPEFFRQIRTEKQVGYIVYILDYFAHTTPGTAFLIQSPTVEPDKLLTHINEFISYEIDQISLLSSEEFEILKDNFSQKLSSRSQSLRTHANRLENDLTRGDYEFFWRKGMVKELTKLTKKDFVNFLQENILRNRNSVSIYSSRKMVLPNSCTSTKCLSQQLN